MALKDKLEIHSNSGWHIWTDIATLEFKTPCRNANL